MQKRGIISALLVLCLLQSVTGDIIEITDCQLLDQPNTEYVLQNDVSSQGTCFAVDGDEITLNLNGHTVSFYNPSPLDYSFGVICHPSFSPPGRPSTWQGGGDNFRIINGAITQASEDTKHADTSAGTMSHAIYMRNCDNTELYNLTLTANSQYDATILRLRGIENAHVHKLIINNNVQNITNRHWPGQRSLLVEGGSGDYEIDNVDIVGGPHVGIAISGEFDSCDVHDNTISHNQKYVNGYAIAASGQNLDIHHNQIIPTVGRGVHITGDNIRFHHNFLNLKLGPVVDHYGTDDYHNIFTNVHGIKFEGGTNSKAYSNTVIATQPGPGYAPPTPLNIDTPANNANNEIFNNNFTAITYADESGGTAGYGQFDTYATGILIYKCAGNSPGSIHHNNFYSNDRAFWRGSYACSNFKIYNNRFEKLSDATTNGHTIMYNNYNAESKNFNFSDNEFIGFEPDDIYFRSSSYNQLDHIMEFILTVNVVDGDGNPVSNPHLIIRDNDEQIVFDGNGNNEGIVRQSLLMYKMDRSQSPDINYHTPYSIELGDQVFEAEIDKTKNITLSTEGIKECENWQTEHPEWLWCDDFEEEHDISVNYHDYSTNGFGVSNDDSFAGEYSLRQHYTSGQVDAGWISWFYCDALGYDYGDCHDEIYMRWYHKFEDGFEGAPPKMARITSIGPGWNKRFGVYYWIELVGEDYVIVADVNTYSGWIPIIRTDFSYSDPDNIGRWTCHEMRVKEGSDGGYTYWVDGRKIAERNNTNLNGPYHFNNAMLDTYWNGGSPKAQNRYYDNFVISTGRIGCLGSQPPPPPPQPCDEADTDEPYEQISTQELMNYINSWRIGPGTSVEQLMDAIDKWKNGCS